MSHQFYKSWLKITAIVVGVAGPVFFLGSMVSTSEAARLMLDVLSWPLDGQQSFAEPTTRFLSALAGGFLLGWGVMIWFLSGPVYDAAPEGVRRAVVIGLLAWFILDSTGSIASGHASNALFNVIVLLVAVGPMWRPAD
jgi:hypothetical protein